MSSGTLELAADVHDRLLKLVAPASPGSIVASSLSFGRNPALFVICVCAVIFFGIFIIPVIIVSSGLGKDETSKDLIELLQIIGGAGLGSSFYALHTASTYIKSGTFDPKYNNTYLIRFGLGLLSGLILAYFLKEFVKVGASTDNANLVNKISASALALLGGYAAEAVAQILDRVSDTLVALVSGSDKDKIDAAKDKADAEAAKKSTRAMNDTVKKLQKALNAPDHATALANVQDVMSGILDPK